MKSPQLNSWEGGQVGVGWVDDDKVRESHAVSISFSKQ